MDAGSLDSLHREFGAVADGGGVAPPREPARAGKCIQRALTPPAVRPEAVAVMNELGIDISRQWSKSVDEFAGREFDFVITVCDHANAVCPVFPGNTRRLHWPFEDPAAVTGTAEAKLEAFRLVRDQIQAKSARVCSAPLYGRRLVGRRKRLPTLRDRPALADGGLQVLVGFRVVGDPHLRRDRIRACLRREARSRPAASTRRTARPR